MLENLKILLGITDTEQDERLNLILENTRARLRLMLGGMEPPEELNHVIVEVAVIRFNRIGSEGLSSHTVEGESYSFTDDDFSAYSDELEAFLRKQESSSKGKVRFL